MFSTQCIQEVKLTLTRIQMMKFRDREVKFDSLKVMG
ncbi:MAG: hypothetical protein ACI94Z_002533, partial [Yoonia sp.]